MPSRVKNNSRRITLAVTTVEKKADALRIADLLISERLAACVNIVPGITSLYRWKGRTVKAREYLLIIKTRTDLVQRLGKRIREVSPYDLPEFIVVDRIQGDREYLDWISASTQP